MNKFQIFRLNISWDMSKIRYLVTNFQKARRSQRPITFRYWWSKVRDFAKLWCFKLIDEIELLKNQLWCHSSDVITITSQKYFILASPNQNFCLRQWIKVIVIVQKVCNWSNSGANNCWAIYCIVSCFDLNVDNLSFNYRSRCDKHKLINI